MKDTKSIVARHNGDAISQGGIFEEIDGVWLDGLQFCSKVYGMFRAQRAKPNAITRWRLRSGGFEKKTAEELLPISRYIQAKYRTGYYISIRWRSGSQSFDAEIVRCGEIVECYRLSPFGFLEVTSAMHANDHLLREGLENGGFVFGVEGMQVAGTRASQNREITSTPVVHANHDFIETMAEIALTSIRNKINKNYPENAVLIVQCTLNAPYLEDEWQRFISVVQERLPSHDFEEIWVCDSNDLYCTSLSQRKR